MVTILNKLLSFYRDALEKSSTATTVEFILILQLGVGTGSYISSRKMVSGSWILIKLLYYKINIFCPLTKIRESQSFYALFWFIIGRKYNFSIVALKMYHWNFCKFINFSIRELHQTLQNLFFGSWILLPTPNCNYFDIFSLKIDLPEWNWPATRVTKAFFKIKLKYIRTYTNSTNPSIHNEIF